MSLTFFVEDEMHGRIRRFADDAENSFLNLCRKAAADGSVVMDVIDPYTDTMLNYIQLDRLIAELAKTLDGPLAPNVRTIAQEVHKAAQEAREISGYLFIQGD